MTDEQSKLPRQRSPAYPYLSLQDAIENLSKLFKKERYSSVPIGIALKHMGYSGVNGASMRVIAALIHFGLINSEGEKQDRKVGVSDLGRNILNERDDSKRLFAIQEAALRPSIHQWVWQKWKLENNPLPSGDNIAYTLIRERDFTDDAAHAFTKEFIATYEFAELFKRLETDIEMESQSFEEKQEIASNVLSPQFQPSLSQIPQEGDIRELTIPLTGRKLAMIRVPKTLNKRDFQLLTMWLQVMENAELYNEDEPNQSGDG